MKLLSSFILASALISFASPLAATSQSAGTGVNLYVNNKVGKSFEVVPIDTMTGKSIDIFTVPSDKESQVFIPLPSRVKSVSLEAQKNGMSSGYTPTECEGDILENGKSYNLTAETFIFKKSKCMVTERK